MLIIPPPYPHCVYLLTRADRIVIYVGVTSGLFSRLATHSLRSWWPEVVGIQVESFERLVDAEARESALIALIQPLYNVTGAEVRERQHLEEMRIATAALRSRRVAEMQVRGLQDAIATIEPLTCEPERGVTLAEATTLLPRPMTLAALRKFSQRNSFPRPVGKRGRGPRAANLYNIDDVRAAVMIQHDHI